MRFVTSALGTAVAVALLAGCAGGVGSSVPSGSSVAPATHSGAHLISNVQPPASCPASYITCVSVAKGSPATVEICISNTGNCTSGSFASYSWTQKITTLAGKKFKSIVGKISPNPGNPIEDTITAKKKVKNSKGLVKYVQSIEACLYPSGGSCLTGAVGIMTT